MYRIGLRRALITFRMLVMWGYLTAACGPPSRSDPSCNSGNSSTGVDGGLVCGEPFSMEGSQGAPLTLGIRANIAVDIDLAGVVSTQQEAAIHGLMVGGNGMAGTADFVVTVCDVQFPKIPIPGQAHPTELAFVGAVYEAIAPATVGVSIPDPRTCAEVHTGLATFLIAARLLDAEAGPLPKSTATQSCLTESDTDCLYDFEPDGAPAATMITRHFPALDAREVFVTMRVQAAFDGMVATPSRLLGTTDFQMDVELVGCRLDPLQGGPTRVCNPSETDVVSALDPRITQIHRDLSPFVAVRLEPSTTCAELLANRDQIFGR